MQNPIDRPPIETPPPVPSNASPAPIRPDENGWVSRLIRWVSRLIMILISIILFLLLFVGGIVYRNCRSNPHFLSSGILRRAGFVDRICRPDPYVDYQEVPIQATSLMGGAELIGPGQWLSIARYGKDGTPSAEEWRMVGRVSAVSGNETEKKVIVLAVPTHQAPTLQAALAAKDGPLLVHGPGQTPTATSTAPPTETPTPGPSPTPTSTPTPFIAPLTTPGRVGFEIPTERIASGSAIDQHSLLSLAIVPKEVSGSAPPLFSDCATFALFLDKNRIATTKAADVQTVVVWLTDSRLPEAAAALTHAERVYLVPDESCYVRQTPTATPTTTPTATPPPTPPSG